MRVYVFAAEAAATVAEAAKLNPMNQFYPLSHPEQQQQQQQHNH